MFICSCGGFLVVVKVEEYPKGLNGMAKLNYSRTCTVKCDQCGKTKENQPYD